MDLILSYTCNWKAQNVLVYYNNNIDPLHIFIRRKWMNEVLTSNRTIWRSICKSILKIEKKKRKNPTQNMITKTKLFQSSKVVHTHTHIKRTYIHIHSQYVEKEIKYFDEQLMTVEIKSSTKKGYVLNCWKILTRKLCNIFLTIFFYPISKIGCVHSMMSIHNNHSYCIIFYYCVKLENIYLLLYFTQWFEITDFLL